jgi:hypothetical protein
MATARSSCIRPTPALVALDAKTGKELWKVVDGDPKKGATGTSTPVVVKDKVLIGVSGGEFGVRGYLSAYDLKDGKLAWRAYSMGPDSDTLMDPEKTTMLGKPVGKDSGTATWKGDQWKIGGGDDLGLVFLRPAAQPDLLRDRQSQHLESDAAAGRQSLVDDDLRPRPGHRDGEVGLSDDAARRVGL